MRGGTREAPLKVVFEPTAFDGVEATRVPLKLSGLSEAFVIFVRNLEARLQREVATEETDFVSCLHQVEDHPLHLKARLDKRTERYWNAAGQRVEAPPVLRGCKVVAMIWMARVYFSGTSCGLTMEVPDMVVLESPDAGEDPDTCPLPMEV